MVADPKTSRAGVVPLVALTTLGLLMLAFVAAGPWIVANYGYAVFVPCMFASGGLMIAAALVAPSLPTRSGLLVILALALVMRLLLVGGDPLLSTDIYRYVWDGRVQGAGINPYLYVPADPAPQPESSVRAPRLTRCAGTAAAPDW